MRRLTLIIIFLTNAAFSFPQDSLRSRHYKARFSFQAKYQAVLFNYLNVSDEINQHKTYRAGPYARHEGNMQSESLWNPEFKIDFELPLWLKITCGASYTRMRYSIKVPRYQYSSYYTYAPGSTPHNPIVTGSNVSNTHVGYNKDESEIDWVSTFLGFGVSKQYRRFNFDADYSIALNKVTYAYTMRRIYDLNNDQKSTQTFMFMETYIQQRTRVFLTHQFSTCFSYRLYKHLHLRAGLFYSKADSPLEDDTHQHYSTFKRMRSYAFIAGIAFTAL